jgi:hypothetical protein
VALLGLKAPESKNLESRRKRFNSIRRCFADLIHPRLGGSALQPRPQFLDRGGGALRDDLDGTVREIARDAP